MNLVKCLLAKIYDVRTRKKGDAYGLQVVNKVHGPETLLIGKCLNVSTISYDRQAYKRYLLFPVTSPRI